MIDMLAAAGMLCLTTLLLGLAAGGLAILGGALPWPERLLAVRAPRFLGGRTLGEKPLSCPACMGSWGAIVAGLLWWLETGSLPPLWPVVLTAAAGIGAWMHAQVRPPPLDLE